MAYRNIAKGLSLASDHTNYLAWLEQDTAQRQAAYATLNSAAKSTTTRISGYIRPFGLPSTSQVYIPHKIMSADQSKASNPTLAQAVASAVGNYQISAVAFEALTSPVSIGTSKGFTFAKFRVSQIISKATSKTASRITKRLYYRNHVNVITTVFGRNSAGFSYTGSTAAIYLGSAFQAVLANTNQPCTYSFTSEQGVKSE